MPKYENAVKNTGLTTKLTDFGQYVFKYPKVKDELLNKFNLSYTAYIDRIRNNSPSLTQVNVLAKVQEITGIPYTCLINSTNVPKGAENQNQ